MAGAAEGSIIAIIMVHHMMKRSTQYATLPPEDAVDFEDVVTRERFGRSCLLDRELHSVDVRQHIGCLTAD